MIDIDAVSAGYDRPVVGPVSFSIRRGEVVGLSGGNGTGKSTLLRAITGEARIFSGGIRRARGLRLNHHQQRFDRPPEVPLLGRELLGLLNVNPANVPGSVEALLDQSISVTSGGQFQLLQACACLCGDADLVLLDEPTNNLDEAAIAIVGQLLTAGAERGVLLVSHERDFLAAHCHRIIQLPASGAGEAFQ